MEMTNFVFLSVMGMVLLQQFALPALEKLFARAFSKLRSQTGKKEGFLGSSEGSIQMT